MNPNSNSMAHNEASVSEQARYLLLQDESSGKTTRWCYTCCNFRLDCPDEVRFAPSFLRRGKGASILRILNFGELEVSADSGCRYCGLAVKVLRDRWPEATPDALARLLVDTGKESIGINLHPKDATNSWHTVDIFSASELPPPWPGLPKRREPIPYGDPDCAFQFLKDCLDHCLATHASCSQEPSEFPTRLLQVGTTLNDPLVRLVEPESGSRGHYVALSYCWGEHLALKCTTRNRAELMQGFGRSELPQTLQDAVTLTIRLGLRYIWIDCLCIVQDDAEDWEHESSKMGDVYHRAYLTIAAASSPSSDRGFLHQRDMPETLRMPFTTDDGVSTVVCYRPVLRSGIHGGRSEPWKARGWTFQEELLSSRLITYTVQELQWTCLSQSLCECGGSKPEFLATNTPLWKLSDAQDAFRMWQNHVEDFADRHLSFAQDKLPAVAGLAQAIHRVVKCSYVAGMWSDNLIDEMSWCRRRPAAWSPPCRALPEFRAPSWSWASVDGPVIFYGRAMGDGITAAASVVAYDVRGSKGAHKFGRVQEGWIQLRGHVLESTLDTSDGAQARILVEGKKRDATLDVGWAAVPLVEADVHDASDKSRTAMNRWAACRPFQEGQEDSQLRLPKEGESPIVWLLQLGRFHFRGSNMVNDIYLILGRAPGDDQGRYQRIGTLRIPYRDPSEWPQPLGEDVLETITIV